jgi:hypothetical protein
VDRSVFGHVTDITVLKPDHVPISLSAINSSEAGMNEDKYTGGEGCCIECCVVCIKFFP